MSFFGILFRPFLASFWQHFGLQNGAQNRAKTTFWVFFQRCVPIPPFGLHFGSLLDHFWLPKAPFWDNLPPFLATFAPILAPRTVEKQITCTKTRCLIDLSNFGHISQTSRPKTGKNNFITLPVTKRPYQKQGGGGVAKRYSLSLYIYIYYIYYLIYIYIYVSTRMQY